jgi:hypothetical protein
VTNPTNASTHNYAGSLTIQMRFIRMSKDTLVGQRYFKYVSVILPQHSSEELINLGRSLDLDQPIQCALCGGRMTPAETLKGRLLLVEISNDPAFTLSACPKCVRDQGKSHERIQRVFMSRQKGLLTEGESNE